MLTELRIRNFAIIEQVTLPLAEGFNVLSGETGAGKSIIVEALGLLLGERASADLIRSGAEKATVEGVFDVTNVKGIVELADERGIEVEDDTLVLKREIATNGRGRAWINGATVTATVLAEIGRQLVNLHGQHDAQTLLDGESQRRILDAFGGAEPQAAMVRATYAELSGVRREIASLTSRRAEAEKRADYLRHVAKEIEDARLSPGEDTKLEDEARVLENADELRTLASSLSELLSGEDTSVLSQLGAAQRPLTSIERIDPSAARMQELFDAGFYALQELARSVEDYAGSVDLDPCASRRRAPAPRSAVRAAQEVRPVARQRDRGWPVRARGAGPDRHGAVRSRESHRARSGRSPAPVCRGGETFRHAALRGEEARQGRRRAAATARNARMAVSRCLSSRATNPRRKAPRMSSFASRSMSGTTIARLRVSRQEESCPV